MDQNKIALVLRIAQCLQNKMYVTTTIFKKIPYVLQHSGVDLGLNFEMGVNSPYSKDFDDIFKALTESNLIEIYNIKKGKIVIVTKNFDISHYEFTDEEKLISNKVYKLFLNFKTATEVEIFTVLMDGSLEKSQRYKNERYLDITERMRKILINFNATLNHKL